MPSNTKDYSRKYYLKNREKMLARNREMTQVRWATKHERQLVNVARNRAKKKGLSFDITEEDIVIPDICPVLKVKMERRTPYAPSIDRIDSSKGYIKGNVQVISLMANKMKNNSTEKDLRNFAQWVIKTYQH